MSRSLPGELKTIQFQEKSVFVWHELCFATARLLLVQAINYWHFKSSAGTYGHTLTTSTLLLFSSFSFVLPKNIMCCPEQGTRPGSTVTEKRVERPLQFDWEELGFTRGGVGNTKRIPHCFPTCYSQRRKQLLKLYILILKCRAWNLLRVKCWCYPNYLGICHDFTQTLHRIYQDDKTWELDCFFPAALQTVFTVLLR